MPRIVKIIGKITYALDRTGTEFTKEYNAAGQIISKVVGVGAKNMRSKYKTMTTHYADGKPESCVLRTDSLVKVYAKLFREENKKIIGEWKKILLK